MWIVENVGKSRFAVEPLQPEISIVVFPSSMIDILVFPLVRIPGPGFRFNIVPPHILRTFPVGPDVLAGNRTGVAANALIEVEHHCNL